MDQILFRNANVVDGTDPEPREGCDVLVEGDRIREVSDRPIASKGAIEFDVGGRTLMPGLIDCHCHVTLTDMRLSALEDVPPTLMTARAGQAMRAMLDRGFTTIRDAAGADWGLQKAVEDGLLAGPRMFISGRALSQTGGHGDFRRRAQATVEPCGCANALAYNTTIADGVPEVRKAAREELRKGANQIKVMVSGGVASPNDPLGNTQYSAEELRAIVEEARAWHTYVFVHAYTSDAITHAVECGARTVEHGNLVDLKTAKLMAERGVFMVPTLVTYDALDRRGKELGMPEVSLHKLKTVLDAGLRSIEICKEAGVRMGFGSDLLGATQEEQSREFLIRSEVQSPHEVITAATATNAAIVRAEGELGVIAEGALADILIVDGNPLEDLGLLQDQGAHLSVIMQGGRFHKNQMSVYESRIAV